MTPEPSHHELDALGGLARAGAEEELGPAELRWARERFLARLDRELSVRTPLRPTWLWAASAAALASALTLALLFVLRWHALSWQVAGAVRDGDYVRASSERAATLSFTDHTTIVAEPSSRLRVEEVNANGARVLVERGRAAVHVVHHDSSAWTFMAGPFQVQVTGTRFTIDWDPAHEVFEIAMLEGSVLVRGPTGSGPVALGAGQRLRGEAQRGSMLVSSAGASAALNSPAAAAAAPIATVDAADLPSAEPESAESETRGVRARRRGSADPGRPSFQELIARGKFAEIVAEVESHGTEQCLNGCTSSDLRALSDAARYTGKSALAEQSLLALRRRFASGAGREAAFLLGRLEERRSALSAAERWYDSYLREAPGEHFTAEALAGKMRTVRAQRGNAAAAPLAEQYLARFPSGVHVATAREILRRN